jgi:hypothetical protein
MAVFMKASDSLRISTDCFALSSGLGKISSNSERISCRPALINGSVSPPLNHSILKTVDEVRARQMASLETENPTHMEWGFSTERVYREVLFCLVAVLCHYDQAPFVNSETKSLSNLAPKKTNSTGSGKFLVRYSASWRNHLKNAAIDSKSATTCRTFCLIRSASEI